MQGSKTPTLAASSISKYFRFLCLIVSPPTPNLLQQYVILLVTPPVISQLLIAARWVGIVLLHHFTKHIPPTQPAHVCAIGLQKPLLFRKGGRMWKSRGRKPISAFYRVRRGIIFLTLFSRGKIKKRKNGNLLIKRGSTYATHLLTSFATLM